MQIAESRQPPVIADRTDGTRVHHTQRIRASIPLEGKDIQSLRAVLYAKRFKRVREINAILVGSSTDMGNDRAFVIC